MWKGRASQEIKDLQPGEVLWVERPVCAAGDRVIISLYRDIEDKDDN